MTPMSKPVSPPDDIVLAAEARAAAIFHAKDMPYTADIINRLAARLEQLALERLSAERAA